MFRLDRIQQVGEQFSTCGDYLQGIVRIHCYAMFPALVRKWPNELVHSSHSVWESDVQILSAATTIFAPFSARDSTFVCSQKRTLLFAEHLINEVLLCSCYNGEKVSSKITYFGKPCKMDPVYYR